MFHFIKNEEKLTISYGDSKWDFTLNTTNEYGKLFYDKLKEKKIIELKFQVYYSKFIASPYDDNFRLIKGLTLFKGSIPLGPYNIFAGDTSLGALGITFADYELEHIVIIGKIIGTSESLSNFSSLMSGLRSLTLVFTLEENQKESNLNYNIDLILLIMFIIIIILIFVFIIIILK